MTVRDKALLIIGLTLLGLVLILYFVLSNISTRGFSELETKVARQNVGRSISAIYNDIADIDKLTSDWAWWDDTYAFIEDDNDKYREANLVDTTFSGLELSLALYIHSSGQIVFATGFDLENDKKTSLPEGLKAHLATDSLLVHHQDTGSKVAGLVVLPEGPMLVASRPILTSKGEGPIRGTLIFGRYLDCAKIGSLARSTYVDITLHRYDDLQLPSEVQKARSSLSQGGPVVVSPLSDIHVAGYTVLKDIYRKPALLVQVEMDRDIYAQGQVTQGPVWVRNTTIYVVFTPPRIAFMTGYLDYRFWRP